MYRVSNHSDTIVLNVDDIQCFVERRAEVKAAIQNKLDRTYRGTKHGIPGDFGVVRNHTFPANSGVSCSRRHRNPRDLRVSY